MKIVYLLFFCLISIYSSAQKGLKFYVDKITNDTLWSTGMEKIYSKASFSGTVGEQLRSAVSKGKIGATLSFAVQTGKTSIFSVEKGSKAILKLTDGTVVNLDLVSDVISDFSEVSYGSQSMAHFYLTKDQIDTLRKNSVAIIRIESSIGTLDYELKDKFKNVITGQVNRIL